MNNKKEETSGNVKYVILKDAKRVLESGNFGCRIKAVRDIPRHGVKAGDIGGFVEHEGNLSQRGDCWIADDAEVSGNATVCDNAIVKGASCVGDNAVVCNCARVGDFAIINGDAIIGDNARVKDGAYVCGHASVEENAVVCNTARVSGNARVCGCACVDSTEVKDDALIRDCTVFHCRPIGGRSIITRN